MLLSIGWKPGKIRLYPPIFFANLILVQFKDLISGVDDPALDPTDGADGGGEDDEDDGEGEEGEEQQLHGEGETREEWGGLRLRIFHQVWMGETKLEHCRLTISKNV